MKKVLNAEDVKNLVIGGCILGGGGGGSMKLGLQFGMKALEISDITLLSPNELNDEDMLICASMVGAPSAKDQFIDISDYEFTINKVKDIKDADIKGIFTNENGGCSSFNGFIQSAISGLPLIDAPANGRAHPTGIMGSLNLHKNKNYRSIQIFSGGNPEKNMNINGTAEGNLNNCSKMIRYASVVAGGLVAVLRNPVNKKYLMENGAPGALSDAISLGKVYSETPKDECPIQAVADYLKGEIVASGELTDYNIVCENGFDVGTANINNHTITFWNEYMLLEDGSSALYSFPDLIMTFDSNTKRPVTSAELKEGMDITVIGVKKENLNLSTTMFDETLLKEVDDIIKNAR